MSDTRATVTGATTDPPAQVAAAALGDPSTRGRTTISDQVAARIATVAAQRVPGTETTGGTVQAALGRQYPDVSARVAGHRVTVSVEVAVRWAVDVAATARSVRERVRQDLSSYAGLQADRVDVTVAAVTTGRPSAAEPARRVR